MNTSICYNFAKKLKEIRELKKLSKTQLSTLVGCDISYIGQIERCKKTPTLKTIEKLANALDVPVKDLFDFE
jgi:transcriptional regulator with XRE-family HTH domain